MKNKKYFFAILVLILIIIAFSVSKFYSKDAKDGEKKILKMGTFSKAIGDAPLYIAERKGWLAEAAAKYGYELDFTIYETLPPINEGFATGNLDIIGEAEPPAIIGYAADIGIRVIGIQSTYIQQIVVPKDSEINSISDLRGKKIAVLSGTSSQYALPKLLKENNISENEVEIFDMAPADARVAFETGQLDAWAVWSPWVEQQIISGKGKTLSDAETYIQVLAVARDNFVKENPQLTDELLEIIERAKKWSIENEEEAQLLVAEKVTLPVEVVEEAWKTMDLNALLGEKEIQDIQAKADFFFSKGKLKKEVNALNLVIVE